MSSIISGSVQNLNIVQKEFKQPNLEKERVESAKSQNRGSDISNDTVEIQNPPRESIESSQVSNEIKDAAEARQTVEKVVERINSESDTFTGEPIHNLNPGSIVDLLA